MSWNIWDLERKNRSEQIDGNFPSYSKNVQIPYWRASKLRLQIPAYGQFGDIGAGRVAAGEAGKNWFSAVACHASFYM